jgi:hypothetical protein
LLRETRDSILTKTVALSAGCVKGKVPTPEAIYATIVREQEKHVGLAKKDDF